MTPPTEPMLLGQVHSEPLILDTRLPRTERDQTRQEEEEDKAVVELANIMTTASNPVSPGSSSPQHDQGGLQDFVPPTRPSSTPFPHPDPRNATLRRATCPAEDLMDLDEPGHCEPPPGTLPGPSQSVGVNLNHLPAEIHECILDHLFGFRISPSSKSSIVRWGTALRHSRRRELSELSLVSGVWRVLIQERLYRHIKLKATIESLRNSFSWFCQNPHLRSYVKHIEVWFPVFQPKYGPLAQSNTNILPTVTADGLTNATYILPGNNCSLEEAFYFVAETFPEVTVLTLEGGERKKAPKVRHWIREERGQLRPMPKVETIRTLICKGQWNLIRSLEDWEAIMSALPNLQEWHGSYSKPKSKSYLTMAEVLRRPMSLSTLNLCIEGDYRRELSFPHYFNKVRTKVHFCSTLAQAAALPSMEHISYTGRVCKQFFVDLAHRLKEVRNPRLKSIDITVKNCCRNVTHWNESGSGITDMFFIKAFEALVLAGIRSLEKLTSVQYLRIRYVDLDSPVPPLNPYFQLRNGWASGVWSEIIVSELNRVRPSVRFEELSESFGEIGYSKDGRMVINPDFPRARALSLKLSNYRLLSGGISISQTI